MRHFDFDKITIQEMSKDDMLLIIEALEFTGKQSNIQEFLLLRDNILEDLASLAELTADEFLTFLKEETLS